MNLLPRNTPPAISPSGADYAFGVFIWLVSAAAALILAVFGAGSLFIHGPGSHFGYEFLPCLAAPVIASIAYAVALARSSMRPGPHRILWSGVVAAVIGGGLTLTGYFL
jgi:hypothetical protein